MAKSAQPTKEKVAPAEVCGIVMPIAPMGDYDAAHWVSVRDILTRAIKGAGMVAQPVWEGLDSDIIHGRIVLNLYQNPVVVCDVSGLNPNVMFELGMRLTFQKPTVIVTDDPSTLPFDTRSIEHLVYPTALHFHEIEEFIDALSKRIKAIRDRAEAGTYKSFIDAFGPFEVAEPKTEEVPIDRYVLDRLDQLTSTLQRIERSSRSTLSATPSALHGLASSTKEKAQVFVFSAIGVSEDVTEKMRERIKAMALVSEAIHTPGLLGSRFTIIMERPVYIISFTDYIQSQMTAEFPEVSFVMVDNS